MLKSKARRRVAVKTAAIGVVGAGIFFGAVPAIASMAAVPKPVSYTCTPPTGGTPAVYRLQMDVTGPLAPTPSATVVATWRIAQPAASPFLAAPSAVTATERLVVDADAQINSTPLVVPSVLRSVVATAVPLAATAGAPLQPPNMLITMTPTATGVIAVQPDAFTLYLEPVTGTGTSNKVALYDCVVATPAEAVAAALLITVKPSGTTSPSPSQSPSATPPVSPSPVPTVTITKTATATSKPAPSRQIEKTPEGAASTGGGGEAGPDARIIMLSGVLMMAGAGIGGLMLRRRTATRG